MASTLVALQTVTVGAGGVASISFTSIPQTYNDLIIKTSAKTDSTTGPIWDSPFMNFNGVSTDQSVRFLYGTGSATGSATDTRQYGTVYGTTTSSTTANTFGNGEIYIPNYTLSNYKSSSGDGVTENNATTSGQALTANLWSKTDPITSITLIPSSGANFVQYSTFTLYGVYKSPLDTAVEAPTIGTATAASTGANVAFTPSGTGAPATSYVATSSPGGITATGTTSPILVTGLTSGTAYTFTVKGQNPGGTGAASAASNSVTPYDGYESIATVYGTGSSGTVSFTSIPSGFTHLQIRAFMKNTSNSTNLYIQCNSDTGSNYSYHYLYGSGTAAASGAATSTTFMLMGRYPTSTVASAFGPTIVDILDYKDTNKYKTLRSLSGWDTNGSGEIWLMSGSWRSTSAISTLTLNTDATNWASGTVFELYGIRG